MDAFRTVTSVAAPLMQTNIDTDAIIPSREMKAVSKEGLAEGLFAGWRYRDASSREPNPEFVLNRAPYTESSLLVAGRNFGCGSSREHAVWALKDWGIRAIIAPSFGSIFQSNCIRNGVLPVALDEIAVNCIADAALENPTANRVTVDLGGMSVVMGTHTWKFDIPEKDRQMLLLGLDAISLTMQSEDVIAAFEAEDRVQRPWIYL